MRLPSKLKIGVIVVLLIAFFIVLNLPVVSKGVRNIFYSISSPIQKSFWRAGDNVSDFFEWISEIKKIKEENDELELKIKALLAENAALKELKKENEILREALEIGLEKDFNLVLAEIISKDVSQDFILINKGSREGISKDFPVITQQKTLVGKISEVYGNYSKVILISNKKSSFDAKICDTEIYPAPEDSWCGVYGVAKGRGNLKLFLDLVPREEEIKEGDLIITAALGGIFPEGLLVGEIKEVKKSDIEPFQEAEIKPAYDIEEIETLLVVTNF